MILLGVGYWLLGSPIPTLLAVTGAIAWLVPVMGGGLAVILPFLLGLLTSTQVSLLTVLYTWGVLLALQLWVEPRLFKLRWDESLITGEPITVGSTLAIDWKTKRVRAVLSTHPAAPH